MFHLGQEFLRMVPLVQQLHSSGQMTLLIAPSYSGLQRGKAPVIIHKANFSTHCVLKTAASSAQPHF